VKIGKDYLYPKICENIKFKPTNLIFTDDVLKYLIKTYTTDKGVRGLQKVLEGIVMKINLSQFIDKKCKFPLKMTEDFVDIVLKDMKKKEEMNHSAMMMYM